MASRGWVSELEGLQELPRSRWPTAVRLLVEQLAANGAAREDEGAVAGGGR